MKQLNLLEKEQPVSPRFKSVNVVMYHGAGGVDVNPGHSVTLQAGDEILVIARIDRPIDLETSNGGRGGRAIIAQLESASD